VTALQTNLDGTAKENETLKSQLKSYVSAIQMLRSREDPADSEVGDALGGLKGRFSDNAEMNDLTASTSFEDPESSAAIYEQKLIQVAQMHGELMEFSESLQVQLNRKDIIIRRLRNELVALRGPMPDDFLNEDENAGDRGHNSSTETERPLVNIWIPTGFMTGRGTDVHHVYQIYIRIRETEWNVYRRYNEFHQFHKEARKRDNVFATFQFPPKKNLGHKDRKFVEERRKRLENYLRLAVNHVVQKFPEFSSLPVRKDTVMTVVPFLSEAQTSTADTNKKRRMIQA
jgi:sorting nexin-29